MLAGGAHDYDYQNYGPRHSRSAKIACGEFKGRDVADTEATHVLEFTNAAYNHWSQRRLRLYVVVSVFGSAGVIGGVAQFLVDEPGGFLDYTGMFSGNRWSLKKERLSL